MVSPSAVIYLHILYFWSVEHDIVKLEPTEAPLPQYDDGDDNNN